MEHVQMSQVLAGDWVTSLQALSNALARLRTTLWIPGWGESWKRQPTTRSSWEQHRSSRAYIAGRKWSLDRIPCHQCFWHSRGQSPSRPQKPCSWFRGSEVLVTPPLYEDTQRWMAGRMAGQLPSADCIQGALCSWRLQYFPSGRGKPASPVLRKVTLVSELVGVQSQLCLETTRVPFPLLYDCSVNFRANACKLKLK